MTIQEHSDTYIFKKKSEYHTTTKEDQNTLSRKIKKDRYYSLINNTNLHDSLNKKDQENSTTNKNIYLSLASDLTDTPQASRCSVEASPS